MSMNRMRKPRVATSVFYGHANFERLVDRAHAGGAKVVLVTHDAGQARRLADEVVFMHAGRVETQGPADHFFDAPKSPLAAAFLEGRLVA